MNQRKFTEAEWDAMRPDRLEIARKIGFVQRPPVMDQPYKSRAKKELLRKMYGEYGQAEGRQKSQATGIREGQ
jgi:hypothetical protein